MHIGGLNPYDSLMLPSTTDNTYATIPANSPVDSPPAAIQDGGSTDATYHLLSASPPFLDMDSPWKAAEGTHQNSAATDDETENDPVYESLPNLLYESLSASTGDGQTVAVVPGNGQSNGNTTYDSLTAGAEYDFISTEFGAEVYAPKQATAGEAAATGQQEEPTYEHIDALDEQLNQRRRLLATRDVVSDSP